MLHALVLYVKRMQVDQRKQQDGLKIKPFSRGYAREMSKQKKQAVREDARDAKMSAVGFLNVQLKLPLSSEWSVRYPAWWTELTLPRTGVN